MSEPATKTKRVGKAQRASNASRVAKTKRANKVRRDARSTRFEYRGGAMPRTEVPIENIPRDFFPPVPAEATTSQPRDAESTNESKAS